MVYDKNPRTYGDGLDGVWHCPFPPKWVAKMANAAKHCKNVTEAQVIATLDNSPSYYKVPYGDFLSEPQDARGLPLSLCEQEKRRHMGWPDSCTAIYDYDTVPEVVISNGHGDWPLRMWEPVLMA